MAPWSFLTGTSEVPKLLVGRGVKRLFSATTHAGQIAGISQVCKEAAAIIPGTFEIQRIAALRGIRFVCLNTNTARGVARS